MKHAKGKELILFLLILLILSHLSNSFPTLVLFKSRKSIFPIKDMLFYILLYVSWNIF